ncbi:hypothetical protein ND925_06690 [Vibrio diabolicus]|jgi:hypothetical protein|uniref:hypothetical protein n=1 Tax=Vibrio TaxID=662 RepID=UPI0004D6077F|nr:MULTISPECIES: hypothetical protein [Vibrio]EJG1066084.1 hypothetical protein [Vibrio parahaemolyticus O1]EGR3502816.1 hypothetical protein [Vibrio parahaemolyticus]KPM92249.1 hypothetical protein AOR10_13710 [Vibrio alginolyticus]MBE4244843.1 hypothetical protein [Vibrio parahaemolyticus]MCC9652249.1 hypothetical protein [Vibrio sp. MA64]
MNVKDLFNFISTALGKTPLTGRQSSKSTEDSFVKGDTFSCQSIPSSEVNRNHDAVFETDKRHSLIYDNFKSVQRSPYYALVLFFLAIVAFLYALNLFIDTTKITSTNYFIASTTSDTAVYPIPTDKHILPTKDQERNPGETYSEEESEVLVREYLVDSLKDCFSMNYLNAATVLSRCKSNHLDSETDTQDIFIELLRASNYINIMKKYQTSALLHVDTSSIKLLNKAIAQREAVPGSGVMRSRAVWIYQLKMHYTMEKVSVSSPTLWQVEMIRESAFNKEFPVSIFKIRDIE